MNSMVNESQNKRKSLWIQRNELKEGDIRHGAYEYVKKMCQFHNIENYHIADDNGNNALFIKHLDTDYKIYINYDEGCLIAETGNTKEKITGDTGYAIIIKAIAEGKL